MGAASASRDYEPVYSGVHGLGEQDRDGHRPDAAGDRSDEAGAGAGGVEVHVADVARAVAGVDAADLTRVPRAVKRRLKQLRYRPE